MLIANYDYAMKAVAYTELAIFIRVLFGAFLLRNSLLTPIIYVHFLRQRYHQSKFTESAISYVRGRIDQEVTKPGRPPALVGVWDKVKLFTGKWAGATIQKKPAVPANAAATR